MRIDLLRLPGVGLCHAFTTRGGARVGVIALHSGQWILAVYRLDDPQAVDRAVPLEADEAHQLAGLLRPTVTVEHAPAAPAAARAAHAAAAAAAGSVGAAGTYGNAGATGTSGVADAAGTLGAAGTSGAAGAAGTSGAAGAAGTSGAADATGAADVAVALGAFGRAGAAGADVARLTVPPGSPADGVPVSAAEAGGARVVALIRDGRLVGWPAPDAALRTGDTLVAVGEPDGVAALAGLLELA